MGLFSDIGNRYRCEILKAIWLEQAEPLNNIIRQRSLTVDYRYIVADYYEQALYKGLTITLPEQIKYGKRSILTAYTLRNKDILTSAALYIVGIYAEVYAHMKQSPDWFTDYYSLFEVVELEIKIALATKGKYNLMIEYQKMMGDNY